MSSSQKQVVLVVLASIFAILPQVLHLSTIACAIIVALFTWRLIIAYRADLAPGDVGLRFVALAAFVITCGVQFIPNPGLSLGLIITILCVTLALKIFELRNPRDFVVAFGLLLFLIGIDLCYLPGKATAMRCAASAFFLFLAMILNSDKNGSLTWLKLLNVSLLTLAIVSPLTIAFTLAFPLDGLSKWSLIEGNSDHTTGMSDTMSPGDVAELTLTDDPAFEGRFIGDVPAQSSLYWRASVLTAFDGRRWSANINRVRPGGGRGITGRRTPVEYELKLEPTNGWWVPVLDSVASITSSDPATAAFNVGTDMEVRSSPPFSKVKEFRVQTFLDYSLDADLHESELGEYLQLPRNNPVAQKYGRGLAAQFASKPDIVNAFLAAIRHQPFFYRLDPKAIGPTDPVDDFLFKTREGFCEHYSSAFALVMRSAGIPARVVTGYMGATTIDYETGEFKVQQSEAHAWNEVWLKDLGWVRVDPTASISPDRVTKKKTRSYIRRVTNGIFRFSGGASGFFNFDQKLGLDAATTEDLSEASAEDAGVVKKAQKSSWTSLEIVSALIACFVVLVALVFFWVGRGRCAVSSLRALALVERDIVALVACVGVKRERADGLREFSERIRAVCGIESGDRFTRMLIDLEVAKYGIGPLDDGLLSLQSQVSYAASSLPFPKRLRFITNKAIYRCLSH